MVPASSTTAVPDPEALGNAAGGAREAPPTDQQKQQQSQDGSSKAAPQHLNAAQGKPQSAAGRPPPPPPLHTLLSKFNLGKSAATKATLPYTAAAQAALFSKQDRPLIQSSNMTAPVAATAVPTRTAVLFLGKDWERWHRYDRDSSLQLGWQPRGVASAVTDCRSSPSLSGSGSDSADSGSEDEYVKHASVFSSDDDYEEDEEEDHARRMSSSQSSAAGRRNSDVFAVQRRLTRRARLLSSTSTSTILENTSSRPQSPSPFSPSPHIRERRYSSNGPEAAFLRHETVIGIHTPRSPHSTSPASSSGYRTPSERKFPLAPLSQILPGAYATTLTRSVDDNHTKSSRTSSTSTATFGSLQLSSIPPLATTDPLSPPPSTESGSVSSKLAVANRTNSTQTVHADATPAARKLSLAEAPSRKRSAVSGPSHRQPSASGTAAAAAEKLKSHHHQQHQPPHQGRSSSHQAQNAAKRDKLRDATSQSRSQSRSKSAAGRRPRRTHLQPAPRCPSMAVEGTLYDETGPFVEGAVQDGLSVRIFNGPDVPCSSRQRATDADHVGSELGLALAPTSGEQDRSSLESAISQNMITYLITTPDNRVSSAAKLRRWAMDSNGHFYAAMEIKSVEAKLRAGGALPDTVSTPLSSDSGVSFERTAEEEAAHYYSRELIRSMQETYVEDIVSEIQKAQTLNPDRPTVSRLLKTEDGKYVRLEEDYPEEAFFVLVGCEEFELYPVVALVFVQALRALARFHDAGWLHGDVKLENIMFDVHGRLVVIDYENANMFRKPRRRKHHAHSHHHHNAHGHHGQHQHRELRSRRQGGSRPSSRRGPQGETAGGGAERLGMNGKLAGSASASPAQRRLALDKAVTETAQTASFPSVASVTPANDSATADHGAEIAESSSAKPLAPNSAEAGEASASSLTPAENGGSMHMERMSSHASSRGHSFADDEAEVSEEEEDEEHLVRLISYDWTPPEASPVTLLSNGSGGGGRMMGPSGDLWALGCNLIRAFALRDGVPDVEVREVLLGTGQRAFFKHRHHVLAEWNKAKEQERKDAAEPSAVDDAAEQTAHMDVASASGAPASPGAVKLASLEPPSTPAARVLHRFSQEAPKLMHFVLARCVTPSPADRGWEAEAEGLQLAQELEKERMRAPIPVGGSARLFGSGPNGADGGGLQGPLRKVDAEEEIEHGSLFSASSLSVAAGLSALPPAATDGSRDGAAEELPLVMDVAQAAIRKAIDMSGSMWVRPKLEEARRSLGFGEDEAEGLHVPMTGVEGDGQYHYHEAASYGYTYGENGAYGS